MRFGKCMRKWITHAWMNDQCMNRQRAFCEADQGLIPHCGNPANFAEDLKILFWGDKSCWGSIDTLYWKWLSGESLQPLVTFPLSKSFMFFKFQFYVFFSIISKLYHNWVKMTSWKKTNTGNIKTRDYWIMTLLISQWFTNVTLLGIIYKIENGNGNRLHGIIATLISLQLRVLQYFSFRRMQLD